MKRLALLFLLLLAPAAHADRFTASDGVELEVTLTGDGGPKPTIVEFSPYGRNSGTSADMGPEYNKLLVQIRGTGDSHGSFDALGPRTQKDVAEVLDWACKQPWSDGNLGLRGFSASAITIYNSLHQKLPCVKTAVLGSGTHELYRDLLMPGGISNLIPGAGVLALIGAPALIQSADRDPATYADAIFGIFGAGITYLQHPTLDTWWRERGWRGNANDIPVLATVSFFDVESRGAFQGYRALKRDGAHLLVLSAHDGPVAGTDNGIGKEKAWWDRYLRGVPNGVEGQPRVQLHLADGDREDFNAGKWVRYDAADWPVPGTKWRRLHLGDGTLGEKSDTSHSYPALPSLTTATDPPNAGIVGGFGVNALTTAFPVLSNMDTAVSAKYLTPPLEQDLLSAGPAALRLRLSSTATETGIWAVVSDVWPDGTAHPVASGRLLSSYPRINKRKSRPGQPFGRYNRKEPAAIGKPRTYRVELWPIGNRFKAGHRVRLDVVGASVASAPGVPAVNTVHTKGSRLLLPVLP